METKKKNMTRPKDAKNCNNYHYKVVNLVTGDNKYYLNTYQIQVEYSVSKPTVFKKIKNNDCHTQKLNSIQIYKIQEPVYIKVLKYA